MKNPLGINPQHNCKLIVRRYKVGNRYTKSWYELSGTFTDTVHPIFVVGHVWCLGTRCLMPTTNWSIGSRVNAVTANAVRTFRLRY